ncbi:group II intron maturase-specific domain-containing protein [Flavimarina sp. Hel_I_48]|uniref:group II intron maturase-specific domain-containing protein n=1 Tax=Flavimarina sp. Hel_I_48 TaxID=1392488 RepID=UPI002935216A|nr:group II intron maturase-specific domain-containing protein [Flavimarina sp. Hel_I_48]
MTLFSSKFIYKLETKPSNCPVLRGELNCKTSLKSKVRIRRELREIAFHNKTHRGIQDLAILLNSKIRGWIQYMGR